MADPFTTDVIAAGLDSAATEMFDVLRKTAMSPIIYEVLDVGTGITDGQGALVSSGAGIPSFVGVLDKSIAAIRAKFGDSIAENDIFVTNDPNYGGVTHLNDIVVAEPVFWLEECVAWVASIAHWGDVGGRTPGSMSTDNTDIVAEGLRLPIVRLFEQGVKNQAIFDIISVNSRLPEFVQGDLWAQVSAGRRAAKLLRELCERYGTHNVQGAISHSRSIGKKRAIAGLKKLPYGQYTARELQDDSSTWSASISISPTSFTVDLRDAPPEATGPYNTGRDGTVVACQVLFKALTDPERFSNAGSFAPLRVLTTPGTIFHAGPTAAHAYYFESRIRLIDMLWHCLSDAFPNSLPAGHFASIFGTVIAGVHPDTHRRYAMVEPQMGGWGATSTRDGQSAMFSTSHGDTFNCPVEIAEARYGFDVIEKRLVPAPHVENECRGGAGVQVKYQMRNGGILSTGYSHATVPVWSKPHAHPGGLNRLTVTSEDGVACSYHMASGIVLNAGDVVELQTAFGGYAGKSQG